MILNKDLIVRTILALIVIAFFIKIALPFILEMFKGKLFSQEEKDIDILIKRQEEKLKSQYGINKTIPHASHSTSNPDNFNPDSDEIRDLYKESKWGGGQYTKEIKALIAQNYAYTFADVKINSFIQQSEKRQYLKNLSAQNQNLKNALINYLSFILVFETLTEEMKSKNFAILNTIAKKLKTSTPHLALALQLKMYHVLKKQKGMKEDKVFSDKLTLHLIPDEHLALITQELLHKEANSIAKGHSAFFEELSLYLTYADLLIPLAPLRDKKDLEGAYRILGLSAESDIQEIKQKYKKLALSYHPDKLAGLNLPKLLETPVKQKFTTIQMAYDLIIQTRK